MSGHTRGPWKSRHTDYAIWDESNTRWVIVSAPKRGEIGRFKRDQDAILASAAPDLLDALEIAVQQIRGEGFDPDPACIAAIAKARGAK